MNFQDLLVSPLALGSQLRAVMPGFSMGSGERKVSSQPLLESLATTVPWLQLVPGTEFLDQLKPAGTGTRDI